MKKNKMSNTEQTMPPQRKTSKNTRFEKDLQDFTPLEGIYVQLGKFISSVDTLIQSVDGLREDFKSLDSKVNENINGRLVKVETVLDTNKEKKQETIQFNISWRNVIATVVGSLFCGGAIVFFQHIFHVR